MKICKKCEDVCKETDNFCPKCGDKLEVVEETVEVKVEETTESPEKKYKLVIKKCQEVPNPAKIAASAIAVTALVGAVVYLIKGRD